jgi:adenylate cyclase
MHGDEITFGPFRLDLRRRELLRDDRPVHLGGRPLDVLCALASAGGDVVSKDELMTRLWAGRVVEEGNIYVNVSALRKALDDNGEGHAYIVTVPGRGYRLAAVHGLQLAALSEQDLPLPTPALVASISRAAVAPRLSIVVLPFANLSDDPEQQYFADGITEDVTTDLSRLADIVVISRNTAFTYQGKRIDTKQIGRELRVRYVLEGSVRRSGNQIRVNAQLIDAETDAHLWAERFDGNAADLFSLQDEITSRIAVALNLELVTAEVARAAAQPDALDYILRGRAAISKPMSRESYAEGIGFFERALVLDPRSTLAQSHLASALMARLLGNMTDSAAADLARAEALAEEALTTSPRSVFAHTAKGQVLRAQRRYAEAIPKYETVLASDRNLVSALHALGQCKLFTGSIDETIPLVERAILLSPRDPQLGVWYLQVGVVHLLQSRTHDAVTWLESARNATPAHPSIRLALTSAYSLIGEIDRAAAELAEARKLSGDNRFSSLTRLRAVGYWGVPKIRALYEATVFAGLRKAGMPEE